MISKVYIIVIGYIVISIIIYFMLLTIEKIVDRYQPGYDAYYLFYSIVWIITIPLFLLFLIFSELSDKVAKIVKQKFKRKMKNERHHN